MRNRILALTLGLLAGCSSTSTFELKPTEPLGVRETSLDLTEQLGGETRLLVLSPLSLEQVTGRLTHEVPNASTTASEENGLGHTTDYNVAASALEAHLVNSGYKVVSQAALAQYAEDGGKAGELEAMRAKGNLTLLEAALVLAPAADADAALLIRDVEVYYDPTPLGWLIHPVNDVPLYVLEATAVIDAVLVNAESKEVVWSGRTRVRARDLLEAPGQVVASSNGYVDNTYWHYTHLRWPVVGVDSLTATDVKRVEHPEVINDLLEFGTGLLVDSLDRLTGRIVEEVEPTEGGMEDSDEGAEDTDEGAEDTDDGMGATDDGMDAGDEAPADEAPADEAPADEAPADEAPADEAPADEAPADEAPADEAPADDAPAADDGMDEDETDGGN